MSLLSRYYYRKYMVKTLTNRMSCCGSPELDDIVKEVNEVRSALSTINETYESAASGFFASGGEVINTSSQYN